MKHCQWEPEGKEMFLTECGNRHRMDQTLIYVDLGICPYCTRPTLIEEPPTAEELAADAKIDAARDAQLEERYG